MGRGSLNVPHAARHLVVAASSPPPPVNKQSTRFQKSPWWMAPPQDSFHPLWPLLLVYHLLVWPAQYTVYTWSWNRASDGQIYLCISCGCNWDNHHRNWNLCRSFWGTYHRGLCQTSKAHRAMARRSGPWFCHCGPEFPFLPCWSSRGSASLAIRSAMMTRSSAYMFSEGHPVRNSRKRNYVVLVNGD